MLLRYYGDPVLRTRAEKIAEITPDIVKLAQDMIETMIAHNGVGLAAPQVGKLLRIYIFRDEWQDEQGEYHLGEPQVAINPELSSPSRESVEMVEGCLSLPGVRASVSRPRKIHVRYQNLEGTWIDADFEGLLARVNMHENDHLNGVLYIDRTDPRDRQKVEEQLRRMKIP
ncbi:MAG: peptide deformylase [Verrucomicrobiota bacterium]|nr:peptide deformylase [Verrucomicrobiota bacterium]